MLRKNLNKQIANRQAHAGNASSSSSGGNGSNSNGASGEGQISSADIRLQRDLADIDKKDTIATIEIPDKTDLKHFNITLKPTEGFYKGGIFVFEITIPLEYPYQPPKVLCTTKVYHPNIDDGGKVCLNILRADWKPVLGVKSVIFGLEMLFAEPTPDDPLNKPAAKLLQEDKKAFQQTVTRYMRGQFY